MPEKLFSRRTVEEKKRILTEEYGMIMTAELEGGIRHMCNWSENMIERGMREGLEKGIEMFILDNLEENIPLVRILEKLKRRFQLDQEKAEKYLEKYAGQC